MRGVLWIGERYRSTSSNALGISVGSSRNVWSTPGYSSKQSIALPIKFVVVSLPATSRGMLLVTTWKHESCVRITKPGQAHFQSKLDYNLQTHFTSPGKRYSSDGNHKDMLHTNTF